MKQQSKVLLLGGIIVDHYLEVDHYPAAGQDAIILNSFDKIGGCALNVGVTLHNLGSSPYIVSKLGDDLIGQEITRYVQSIQLPTSCLVLASGRKTGYCHTILDQEGERTFLTYIGVEKEFSADILPNELLKSISFVYITGYYLLNWQSTAAVLDLVKQLKRPKCQILFDPGPLVAHIDPAQLQEMMALSDWIIPNSSELEFIRQVLNFKTDPVRWLLDQGCRYVVVKNGEKGVDFYSVTSSFSLKGFQVKTVDTTGAGDSFTGGLIHALSNHLTTNQAVEFASACGAYTATIEGPHGFFTLQEIEQFIKNHKDEI